MLRVLRALHTYVLIPGFMGRVPGPGALLPCCPAALLFWSPGALGVYLARLACQPTLPRRRGAGVPGFPAAEARHLMKVAQACQVGPIMGISYASEYLSNSGTPLKHGMSASADWYC